MNSVLFWAIVFSLLISATAMNWVGFYRTGRIFIFLRGMSSLSFAIAAGTYAVSIASPTISQHGLWPMVISRTGFSMGAIYGWLAADAYLASTNGHWSIAAKCMRPLEKWWVKKYGEKRTGVDECDHPSIRLGTNGGAN